MKIAEENDPRMKYLRRGLARRGPTVIVSGQRVQRDRQYFQAQEQAYQPGRLRHEHRAGGADHHEHVRFGAVQVFPGQVAVGDQGAEDRGRAEQDGEKGAEVVVDNLAGQGDGDVGGLVEVGPLHEAVDDGGQAGEHGDPGPEPRVAAFGEHRHQ